LQAQLNELMSAVKENQIDTSAVAELLRRVLRAISSENLDCPRLFTMFPKERRWLGPQNSTMDDYSLHLWCEHPNSQHPVKGADYTISLPREWVTKIQPFVHLIASALKLAVPLAAPTVTLLFGAEVFKEIKPHLEFMEKFTSGVLAGELDSHKSYGLAGPPLTRAEGASLRALQEVLIGLDPGRKWGGLRKVGTSSGDCLWVCPQHYPEYDPGLPVLPGSNSQPGHR
jgi:internalin A